VNEPAFKLPPTSRPIRPDLADVLARLRPGQRLRITQTVRVGAKTWTTTIEGTFRELNSLATGIATSRVPEDDIVVPILHFIKDNKELSSVALDEHSKIEILAVPPSAKTSRAET
jgi:hypothetical protein